MPCSRFLVVVAVLLAMPAMTAPSYSYEPPHTSALEAIDLAQVAVMGRIVALRGLTHGSHFSTAEMTLEVTSPLLGLSASEGDLITIRYHTRHFSAHPQPGFPAPFRLSSIVLLAFRRPATTEPLQFHAVLSDGIDLAYELDDAPRSPSDDSPPTATSIYGSWSGSLSLEQLLSRAKARAAVLRGEDR